LEKIASRLEFGSIQKKIGWFKLMTLMEKGGRTIKTYLNHRVKEEEE
jgi:hypothetical protein